MQSPSSMMNSKGSPSKPNFSKAVPSSRLPVYLTTCEVKKCQLEIKSQQNIQSYASKRILTMNSFTIMWGANVITTL